MCGIAGIYHYGAPDREVDRQLLERMTRRLAHRGPDDEGFHVAGPLGLGHRRLSIVDLSPTGHQPMTDDGTSWISYNGEFYNHGDYRPQLAARGHRFRGTSDTETLLHLLDERGPGALADVAGIFTFAFWDGRHRRLILARDPLGVKQLYYHDDGSRIVFASEIKALLECPELPREPDPQGVTEYLHFHTPLFERTFFRDIRQVRAGEYLEVNRHGVHPRRYWQLDGFTSRPGDPEDHLDALRRLLTSVVGEQLMSDVPVGSFFSGGIDSSAVAAFATRHGKPPICFGVHFTDQGVIDEAPFQEAAARAMGLELELTTLDGSTFPEDLLRLMYFQDEPVIGAAMLPMYYVSRLASRRVKVCLGGQGADEIFAGYARYALAHPLKTLTSYFAGRRVGRGEASAGQPSGAVHGNLLKQLLDAQNLRRLLLAARHATDWRARYFDNFAKVPEKAWNAIFSDRRFSNRTHARNVFDDTLSRSSAEDPVDKLLHWDMQTYLPGLFHQEDRMSMANSIESRVPLADPRLVRFAFHTPYDLKLRGGATKWLLRQVVADVVPELVLNRRKVGFDTPTADWMRGPQRGFIRELLLSTNARTRGFWNPAAIETLLAHPERQYWADMVWKLSAIEAWARIFLDRETPSGIVEDQLAHAA